jgi:hypothetical protein
MNFKIIIAAAVVTASLTSQAFAGNGETKVNAKAAISGETANAKVTARFNSDFQGASGIWNIQGSYDEVLFVWRSQLMQSYYTKDGQLIGTYHRIEAAGLPAAALLKILTGYKDYQLKDASIIERPSQDPGYFATLVGKGRILKLEISADGEVNELN